MGKRADMELEAIRRYAEGMEIPAISAEIAVSENSLRKWKTRAGTEWGDARKAIHRSGIASMEDVGARMRRVRHMASEITGNAQDQSALGLVLNQTLQTMLYDLMNQMNTAAIDPDDMGKLGKLLGNLSLVLGRTEQAASINLKREAEIRKHEREKTLQDAAEMVKKTATKAGADDELIERIRADILGIGTPA
jgi:hypothetical protein